MKAKNISAIFATLLFATSIAFLSPALALAESNQLMLADIVIALRSKKVSLAERNDIIAKAIAVRGVTFTLTPEIEKELLDTGASPALIDSIKQKSQIIKISSVQPKPIETVQKPVEPPPPNFLFYQKRGDTSLLAGEMDAAIADYSKAIEMNPAWIGSYMGRAAALTAKKASPEALLDYEKVIELKPDNAVAHFKHAELLEQKGDIDLALAGYNKAFELDPTNAFAKAAAERIVSERTKAAEKAAAAAAPPPVPAPELIDLGGLSKENAIDLAMPVYPSSAIQAAIGGRVIVNVMLDAGGKVITAKATSGAAFLRPAAEAAAMRSKFKPAMYKGTPIKGKGYISYNFEPRR